MLMQRTADLDAPHPRAPLRLRCSVREDALVFLWTCLLWLTGCAAEGRGKSVSGREWRHCRDTETYQNTLNCRICIQKGTHLPPRVWFLRTQSLTFKYQGSGFGLALSVFYFILFILLFYFHINHHLGYKQDLNVNSPPSGVNICVSRTIKLL